MCKCNSETIDHLLIHFLVAMDLWAMVLGLFGESWVMPSLLLSFLLASKVSLVATLMDIYGLLFLIV